MGLEGDRLQIILQGEGIMASVLRRFVGLFVNSSKKEAEVAVREFCESVASLRRRYNLLNEYACVYYNTFNEAGWNDLTNLLDELTVAEDALYVFIDARRYAEARDIAQFLLGNLPLPVARRCIEKFDGLAQLAGWQGRSQQVMVCVVNTVLDAAQKTKDMGVDRGRTRKPTLLALAELRDTLID